MARTATSLENFTMVRTQDRVAIMDVTMDAVRGTQYFEFASGKTEADARMRFYSRYMVRTVDREMIETAQRRNSLHIMRIVGNAMLPVENNATLIALTA